jgi:vacuolar-type H+-ATPase subunit H
VKSDATSEALTIVARAQESADATLAEATEAAATAQSQAEEKARQLLRDSRMTASEVRTEGFELVENLRQMGDSLRSNAERLLRDVQLIHSRMVAQIDRADGGLPGAPAPEDRARSRQRTAAPGRGADPDVLDVPEFIPPG